MPFKKRNDIQPSMLHKYEDDNKKEISRMERTLKVHYKISSEALGLKCTLLDSVTGKLVYTTTPLH